MTSCLTKAEEPSLYNYVPIPGGRIIGFIPFPSVLVLCEIQSVSSRIWTRAAVCISYDDNHYTIYVCMGGFIYLRMYEALLIIKIQLFLHVVNSLPVVFFFNSSFLKNFESKLQLNKQSTRFLEGTPQFWVTH